MKTEDSRLTTLETFNSAPDDTLFPQPQVKQILPFSDAWFEKSRFTGTGPKFVKIGSKVFYKKHDLLEFINRHEAVKSTSEYQAAWAACEKQHKVKGAKDVK